MLRFEFDKILFLDVDGVLNTRASQLAGGADALAQDLILHLARIIQQTQAKIVISSTWRMQARDMQLLSATLANAKMQDTIVGGTPVMGERHSEIKAWLAAHPTRRFAILDDHPDAGKGDLARHFFWVSSIVGLQESDADAVVRHLNA